MSNDVIDSEVFKFLIKSLNSLLKLLDKIIEITNAVPVPVTAAMVALRKMAGIKFENLITLENTSNLGNAIVSKFKDISEKIKNKLIKSNQDIIETDIRIEPHTIIETDEAEKIISNATDDITEDLQSKINVIKKYFSDKANVKTNNSEGRRSAEWHASENLKNDPNGSQELLELVRGYDNVNDAINAFVAKQRQKITELTANAQQAAIEIEAITSGSDTTNESSVINVDEATESTDTVKELAEAIENVNLNADDTEETAEELAGSIEQGFEEGVEAIHGADEGIQDLNGSTEAAGKGFKVLGKTIAANVAAFLAISAITWVISKIAEAFDDWAHKTENAQNALEDSINEYKDLTSQLDDVNSKLDENAEKIAEINKNPLAITASEDLKNLREQNAQLEYQKQILETTAKLKAKAVEKETIEVLFGKYSYDPENGIEASATGKDYLTRANELFESYSTNFDQINNIKGMDFSSSKDVENYLVISNEMAKQQSHLADVVDYLSVQKNYLNENSDIYKEVNQLLDNIINKEQEIEKNNGLNNFAQNLLLKYENSYANVSEIYKKVLEQEEAYKQYEETAEKGTIDLKFESLQVNNKALDIDSINDQFKQILEKNGIQLFEQDNGFYTTIIGDSYTGVINALKETNRLKQHGVELDTASEEIIKRLSKWIGIEDTELFAFGLEDQLEAYNYFKQYLEDNSIDLTSIGASAYLSFANGFISQAESAGYNTGVIEQFLASFFPDYQTVEDRMYAYAKKNSSSNFSRILNNYISGNGLSADDKGSLLGFFNNVGTSAEDAEFRIRQVANRIINEDIAALQEKTSQAQQDFINNQTDFNDNFSNVKDTFSNAISSISSGSSISYEDMWTLINADSELATKFKKSANGYTIAIEDLTEAQEEYSKETKNTYLKAIEDAQKTIDKARADKDAAYKRLEKINPASDPQLYKEVRTQIDDYNETIETNTELIAKNQLMYEQACDSVSDYGQKLEDVVSKLSTFKSLYASIANDMYKIGRIGAESMVELINAFPEDWYKLVTKSDNGYVLDNEAYTQTVIRKFGFSGADEKTIANDLKTNVEDKLKALADKYNLDYATGIPLDVQFGKIEDQAEEAGKASGEFSSELNSLKDEFKDTNNIASIFADIIKTIIDSFKESQALTDFNNKVSKLQHKLNMGLITQAEYDDGFEAASTNFANAVKKEGLSEAETQEQIWSNEETIHSADQSQYQKELDKKTQDLQDAYDQQLISAREYYDELAKFEDKYYGTETKKGLLDDPDSTNVENKNRQQLERRTTLVNDEIAQIKEDYSRGLITFEEFEQKLGESLEYWLGNIDELQETYKDLKRENISALYEAEVTLANNQLERGKMSNSQYAKEMLRIWEKYYKDKDGYRQEDLEAEQQAVEASRNAVQEQIDAFQHIIDKNEEDAEKQIDNLEKQKEEIEDQYDKQIKDLEEQKDLIEEAADAEDRKLKILEAEEALEKAKNQRTVATVNANGTINYQANPEDVKKAEEDLKEAKKEEETAKLQERIDALEKEKETKTNTIDEEIKKIEEKRDKTNGYLQAVVDMLATLISETYEIDPELIKRLLNSKDAKAELEKINEEREAAGEEAITWADVGSAIASVEELIDNESTQEEKDDTIVDAIENTGTELKPIYKQQLGPDNTDKDTDKNTDKDTNQDTTNNANTNTNNEIANKDNKTDDKIENSEKNDNITTENTNTLGTELNPMYVKLFNTPIPVTITDNVIESVSGEKAIYQTIDNQINNNNNSFTFSGDININNPVANSYDLAEDIIKNLPNAVAKQIHKKNQ